MYYLIKKRFSDKLYTAGVLSIAISLVLLCFSIASGFNSGHSFELFLGSFAITWFYIIYRWISRSQADKENKLHHQFLFLLLALISAYSLNRVLNVFDDSADWFSVILVIVCINYGMAAYLPALPSWAKHTVSLFNGIAVVIFTYLSVYLLPMSLLGMIGFMLAGISLHVFVPALITGYTIALQRRIARYGREYWISFTAGIFMSLVITAAFVLQWYVAVRELNDNWKQSTKNHSGLPAWVGVAQNFFNTSMNKKVLISDLAYTTASTEENERFFRDPLDFNGMSNMNFDRRIHDPLIMAATALVRPIDADPDSRLKILESTFDMQHETQKRLWSGEDLVTNAVNTSVKVWPRCNLVYTEKTVVVKNTLSGQWVRPQEAIYTFYMPEGSVVTSLSLWINGKEQPGILTTKEKANTAYETIVGKEMRDPSVVHWQEGNTVSVRVFPVLPGEERKFKLGITSPMERVDGKLRYENIRFKGPAFNNAEEDILIDFEQPVNDFQLPASFVSKAAKQSYHSSGHYNPSWHLQINDPGLAGCSFSFENNQFTLSPYHERLSPVEFKRIYLDVNDTWTKTEYNAAITAGKGKEIYVYRDGIVKVEPSNKEWLWSQLEWQQFSLFPLFLIEDPAHSLVITKSSNSTMGLKFLENTSFMNKTKSFLDSSDKINVYDLGNQQSLYLRSLKEFRVFRYDHGNAEELSHRLEKGQFPDDIESDSLVVIHKTDMIIEKKPGSEMSGPDHVMRLFAYNHIMQKLGKNLLLDRPAEDSLVQEAQQAYVVTPVSSLVVLEKQEDYDRFDIKNSKNSLGNASMHGKGAAPEPHEWALIVVVIALLVFVVRKRKPQMSA